MATLPRGPERRDPSSAPTVGVPQLALARSLVLVVDDNDDARELYEVYLAFKGFRVVSARNGPEALALARQHRPAVILLDIRMSGMSGFEVAKVLRADPRFARTPIVALTALLPSNGGDQAPVAKFDEVIVKPCLPDELARAVERLLIDGRP